MIVDIFDISSEGEGIGKIDGKIVFVPHSLPGESVEIEITEDKGKFAKGRRIGDRPECGGCPLLRYPYNKQLAWKEKHVRDCLERIAKLEKPKINPIVGMSNPFAYRNKCEFKIGAQLPYCNLDCIDCPIQDDLTKKLVAEFKDNPRKNAEDLIIRTTQTGEYMAYTIQNSGYVLLYDGENIIHDYIETDMGRLAVEVDPFSFYQVNPSQTSKLYSIAQKYANPCEEDTVLDLYCGCGSIGLSMASHCKRVIGVESVKSAVLLANRNAVLNGIVNATFICGKAETAVSEKLQGVNADIIILDPPRSGCKESLIKTVEEIGADRIVYISCNPSTLARDIARFTKYKFVEATPVDMFPHTAHVETVALLSKLHVNHYVNITIDTKDLDLTSAESKATYDEIKEYVLKHTGLKVSNLNIAQIKDKYGIKERVNYNKPKSECSRQPNCPEDKEKAIVDALKYFKII